VQPSRSPSESPGVPLQEGFMADGPGFHVWEESHSETVDSAGSLAASLSRRQAAQLRGRRAGARSESE
jgi:hypothetical protein